MCIKTIILYYVYAVQHYIFLFLIFISNFFFMNFHKKIMKDIYKKKKQKVIETQ